MYIFLVLPFCFFVRFCLRLRTLKMIITITTIKRKNPAPPQARAIISLVDNVEKKVRTPSLLPEALGVGAAMSSGVRTPKKYRYI